MHSNQTKRRQPSGHAIIRYGVIALAVVALNGCVTNSRHSVAYGYHSGGYHRPVTEYYEYHYYPKQHVYYDINRHIYHYNHYDRGWLAVNHLPSHIRLSRRHNKALKYRHNRPWDEAHAHKRHRTHRGETQQRTPNHDSIRRDKDHSSRIKQQRNRPHVERNNNKRKKINVANRKEKPALKRPKHKKQKSIAITKRQTKRQNDDQARHQDRIKEKHENKHRKQQRKEQRKEQKRLAKLEKQEQFLTREELREYRRSHRVKNPVKQRTE